MIRTFEDWRPEARRLLLAGVEPHAINWERDSGLFGEDQNEAAPSINHNTISIPKALPELLANAARFRAADRWALLYRILWRVTRGDRSAMLAGDVDGTELHRRLKAVRREAHHMHAFLRFKPREQGSPQFIAWHEPTHDVLDLGAEHFITRMGRHSWVVATPEGAAHFDGDALHYHYPCPPELRALAQGVDDDGEALWKAYYHSTFNPSRLNEKVMRSHMPARFWQHLPEGPLIARMVSDARAGQQSLGQTACVGAREGKEVLIASDRAQPRRARPTALESCRECAIWENATCAVAGEGPERAAIMLVGEQPGDLEDLAGRPFVGPAGQVLDNAFEQAGVERASIYLTNAVKHFKWEPRGGPHGRAGTRWHATPKPAEIKACHFWLERELETVRPKVVVALGRTALASLLQSHDPQRIRLADFTDKPLLHQGYWIVVAPHPAAILRSRGESEMRRAELVAALQQASQLAGTISGSGAPAPGRRH